MGDVIDINDREFEKAAAEGEEGVLAILRAILVSQDEHRKGLALMTELMGQTNNILTLMSQALKNAGERNSLNS
jgi:hypothetical protein